MSVTTIHPLYSAMCKVWQLNKDAAIGSPAVKRRRAEYLPVPNSEEEDENSARYEAYLKRAVFVNFTGRTIRGLTGAVFRQDANTVLPAQIKYIEDDANNNRLSLATIAQRAVSEVLRAGRYIVLADFPESREGVTAEDTDGMRAYLACYAAEALINWHETGGQLDLAVLWEVREEPHADGFDYDYVSYYRVLRLRKPELMSEEALEYFGRPTQQFATLQLYREEMPYDERVITGFDGAPFDEIPLVVIGSEDNNLDPDMPPISDIASLNIAHYQSSATRREGTHMFGQPTLHIDTGETSAQQFAEVNGQILVGSRSAIVTNGGGSVTLVQAQANDAARQDMIDAQDQMVKLGAQIIADAKGNETAEAARIRSGAETSVLNTVVNNVSDGFEQAIKWVARYMGGNEEVVEYRLNDQFFAHDADPQLMAQIMLGIDRLAWPVSVLQDYARKSGLVDGDVSNDELSEQAQQASPLS